MSQHREAKHKFHYIFLVLLIFIPFLLVNTQGYTYNYKIKIEVKYITLNHHMDPWIYGGSELTFSLYIPGYGWYNVFEHNLDRSEDLTWEGGTTVNNGNPNVAGSWIYTTPISFPTGTIFKVYYFDNDEDPRISFNVGDDDLVCWTGDSSNPQPFQFQVSGTPFSWVDPNADDYGRIELYISFIYDSGGPI